MIEVLGLFLLIIWLVYEAGRKAGKKQVGGDFVPPVPIHNAGNAENTVDTVDTVDRERLIAKLDTLKTYNSTTAYDRDFLDNIINIVRTFDMSPEGRTKSAILEPADPWQGAVYPAATQKPASIQQPAAAASTSLDSTMSVNWSGPTPTTLPPRPASGASFSEGLKSLDSITTLLYLGAFMFVAAVGLFVAVGGLGGAAKTILVVILSVVFYGSGIYLFKSVKRLKPAGLTFIAIGLVSAPLIGVAVYNFWLSQTHGSLVWLVTSVLCVVMYGLALFVTRRSLVAYLLIFTILSLFEASVSVVTVPVYYMVWVLALMSVGMLLLASYGKILPEMDEPMDRSAAVFMPIALTMSIIFFARYGSLQVALSGLLGAFYYGLSAKTANSPESKESYTLLAQLLAIASICLGAYSQRPQVDVIVGALIVTSLVYMSAYNWLDSKRTDNAVIMRDAIYVACLLPVAAALFSVNNASLLTISLSAIALVGTAFYILSRYALGAWLAATAWWLLPLVVGLYLSRPTLDSSTLSWIIAGSGLAPALILLWRRNKNETGLLQILDVSYAATFITAAAVAWGSPLRNVIVLFNVLALAWYALGYLRHRVILQTIAMSYTLIVIALSYQRSAFFLVATLTAMMLNLVFYYGNRLARFGWAAVSCLLMVPSIWGLLYITPRLTDSWLVISYIMLTLGIIGIRFLLGNTTPLRLPLRFGYLTAMAACLLFAILAGPVWVIAIFTAVSITLFLLYEYEELPIFADVAALMPAASCIFLFQHSGWLSLALLVTLVLNVAFFWRRYNHHELHAWVAVVAGLLLPYIAGEHLSDDAMPLAGYAGIYMAVGCLLMVVRYLARERKPSVLLPLQLGYLLALVMSGLFAWSDSMLLAGAISVLLGCLALAAADLEREPSLAAASPFLFHGAVLAILLHLDVSGLTLGLGLTATSGFTYTVAHYATKLGEKARYIKLASQSVSLLIAASILFIGQLELYHICGLAIFGVMLAHGWWRTTQGNREIAVSVIFVAWLALLWWFGIRELQVFTQQSAVLLAIFAVWRVKSRAGDVSTPVTYQWSAMLMLSLPLAWQAIGSASMIYGWLLIVEHVVLLLAGMSLRRPAVAWWGLGVAVAAVLYQLRELRFAALGFLGLFIIALAVYLLLKRRDDDSA